MINFEESANTVFNMLEECYDFKKSATNTYFSLINNSVSIEIYFENHFEVNTYLKCIVNGQKQDINIIALSKYLDFDKNAISLISFNQITDNGYLIKYLECVRSVLLKIIDLVNTDKALFYKYLNKYYQDVFEYRKSKQLNDIFFLLNNLWHDKKYDTYLTCFQKNKKLLTENKNFLLAQSRALYIEKHHSEV